MRETIEIRQVLAADQPFLWEMLYLAIHVPVGMDPPPRAIVAEPGLAKYAAEWGRPGDLGVVAADRAAGDRPVGAAWLRLFAAANPGYGFLDERTPELTMAIEPAYRGEGVGAALLGNLLERAAGRYPAVSLSVSHDNRARRLYERLGFVEVAADASALTMRRPLGPEPPGDQASAGR